jgi:hypothetical protein
MSFPPVPDNRELILGFPLYRATPADFRLVTLFTGMRTVVNPTFGISMTIRNGIPNFTSTGWTSLDIRNLPAYNRASAAVPLPPTVFLLGAGLVGAVILRKKVRK